MLLTAKTKNGVIIYISVLKDGYPNSGGYFCEVYLDRYDILEHDTFVIKKKDLESANAKEVLEYIQKRCDEYALNMDDMRILNRKFNDVYVSLSEAYNTLSKFYMKYIYTNENCDEIHRKQMVDLFSKMGDVKEIAHEVAEHYTWDN